MPATLFLLTPLLSQTALTTLALLEPISFQPFTDPSLSAAALRSWFAQFVLKGLYPVLVFGSVSACVGGRAAWELGGWEGRGGFYLLGAGFSAAHFLFGPWTAKIIDRLINDKPFPSPATLLEPTWGVTPSTTPTTPTSTTLLKKSDGASTKDDLKRWLRMHYTRTLLTDLPALVFFIMGAVEVFGA